MTFYFVAMCLFWSTFGLQININLGTCAIIFTPGCRPDFRQIWQPPADVRACLCFDVLR